MGLKGEGARVWSGFVHEVFRWKEGGLSRSVRTRLKAFRIFVHCSRRSLERSGELDSR